jgi:hypothetical protein
VIVLVIFLRRRRRQPPLRDPLRKATDETTTVALSVMNTKTSTDQLNLTPQSKTVTSERYEVIIIQT